MTQFCVLSVLQVNLLGLDLLSALVTRLQDRFRTHIGTGESLCCGASAGSDSCLASSGSVPVLPSLMDRLGDARDQVREQDQVLLLKIMEQAASPQVVQIQSGSPHRHQPGGSGQGAVLLDGCSG